ncbi:hypothetical protein PBI_MISSWHITE_85 [Mycobacterium phage MissWhite]|nr:hypothetical protein PBI_MISSWHITE_85 [Mycobacterium phage MissWhite]
MFTMTVTKTKAVLGVHQQATVKATHRQMLLDHLEASAGRHNLEVRWTEPRVSGDILKDGEVVATWEVSAE